MNFKFAKSQRMKITLSILMILFCFHTAYAQTIADLSPMKVENKTKLGIKIGYTHSSYYGDDLAFLSTNGESYPLSGYYIAIAANSTIGNHFWLKHELGFQQAGSKVMLGAQGNNAYKAPLKMYALQLLPVSPTLYLKGFQVYAGPYVSLLTAASILRKDSMDNDFKDNSIFGDGKEEGEENKYLQKFDFGFGIGMEYEWSFGLNIGARYTKGVVPIFDKANANTFEGAKPSIEIYNQVWSFSIGYTL